MKFESMSDRAIAQEIGRRLEQLRLEQNRTQQQLADEIGLTSVSYRKLVDGKGKIENLIALLRALGHIDLAGTFVPDVEFSPMQRLRMQGKRRQRASSKKNKADSEQVNEGGLDW